MIPTCLSTTVGGLSLDSLILNASGTFYPEAFNRLFPLNEALGAIVTKTLTPQAQPGNPQQRTVELPGLGMLNSIGLQGKGFPHFMAHDLDTLKPFKRPVVLSLSAGSEEAFAEMVEQVCAEPSGIVQAIELNLSCPNVKAGGALFGASAEWVQRVVQAVKPVCPLPLWVKLTPNVTDSVAIAGAALEGGADALVAINTVLGSHIDIRRKKASLSRLSGGYSGPGIRPIAIHHILQIKRAFPQAHIVGVGGIVTANDVLEFLMAGASAVQVGTACFRSPTVFTRLVSELTTYAEQEGLQLLQELVACVHESKRA